MYGFLKEISQIAEVPLDVVGGSFKVCMLGENIIHVCNFSRILVYSENEVQFRVKGGVLKISGDKFLISQLNPKEMILKGVITSISFEKTVKR